MGQHNTIPALDKSLRLVEAIAGGMRRHSIAELARHLNIPPTTCYRIVNTLIARDWLRPRTGETGYELSLGVLPLVEPFLGHRVLIEVVGPIVNQLAQQTGLAAKLSVRHGHNALTVYRAESNRPLAISSRVGITFHLALGSSGSALMFDLPDDQISAIIASADDAVWDRQSPAIVLDRITQCRKAGYCIDLGSYHAKVQSISRPVRDSAGQVAAAITLLALEGQLTENPKHISQAIYDAATRASKALASSQPADPDPASAGDPDKDTPDENR